MNAPAHPHAHAHAHAHDRAHVHSRPSPCALPPADTGRAAAAFASSRDCMSPEPAESHDMGGRAVCAEKFVLIACGVGNLINESVYDTMMKVHCCCCCL